VGATQNMPFLKKKFSAQKRQNRNLLFFLNHLKNTCYFDFCRYFDVFIGKKRVFGEIMSVF